MSIPISQIIPPPPPCHFPPLVSICLFHMNYFCSVLLALGLGKKTQRNSSFSLVRNPVADVDFLLFPQPGFEGAAPFLLPRPHSLRTQAGGLLPVTWRQTRSHRGKRSWDWALMTNQCDVYTHHTHTHDTHTPHTHPSHTHQTQTL